MPGQEGKTEEIVASSNKLSPLIISIFALIVSTASLSWQILDYSSTHWSPKYVLNGKYMSDDGCGETTVKQQNKQFSASCKSASHAHLLEGEYVDSVTVKLTVTRVGLNGECYGKIDKRTASITVSSEDKFKLVQPSWISACQGSLNAKVVEVNFERSQEVTTTLDE